MDLTRIDLPLAPRLPEIAEALAAKGALVLRAEPGAGKTSLVPLYLAGSGTGRAAGSDPTTGKVLVLEPRRVAAVQAAARAAELAGEAVGRGVGYRVRGETKPGSALEFITEGVFIRMIQSDPGLAGVGTVVFDEFHERSVNADLGLALALDAKSALCPGLRILLMSATLQAGKLASFIEGESLEVEGRSYPVETRHVALPVGPRFEEELASSAFRLFCEIRGDLLVFLPGQAEIRRVSTALSSRLASTGAGDRPEIRELYGSLPLETQRRVLLPEAGARRRIILATSVAETSLTVPRVEAVLDSGLARLQRYEARSGLNRLVTEREAADRAEQRRGRAGRLGPGICLRAWPAGEILPEKTEAEILRAELSGLVLECAVWGARRAADLPWLDQPPASAWATAAELLRELGALDAGGRATEFGAAGSRLGTEPRLAALVLRGAESGRLAEAAALAAILGDGRVPEGKLELALEALERGAPDYARAREEAKRLAEGVRHRAPVGVRPPAEGVRPSGDGARPQDFHASLGLLLAPAFPDRIARRIGGRVSTGTGAASFQLPGGRKLAAKGSLAEAEWLVVAEADSGGEGRVYSGAALGEEEALGALAPLLSEEVLLQWDGLKARARTVRKAGAIVLSETPLKAPAPGVLAKAFVARLEAGGLGILPWEDETGGEKPSALLARMRWFVDRAGPEGWPSLDDASLVAGAGEWLSPYLGRAGGAGQGEVIDGAGLAAALASLVPSTEARRFAKEAPAAIELPSGRRRALDYAGPRTGPGGIEVGPLLEAKPQELYGLKVQPRMLGRPLLVRLLSPAGRPIHTTTDLPGFWTGSWGEIRKELRGRYPKHEWPENPAEASPSASGIKRRN
jgi:ATP-dependent helicase HrpB